MSDFCLNKNDRILGLFPHPDDEALGAGILLQRAKAAGAAVLPVFLTSGEANAWPQRVLDRKLLLSEEDRRRFALRREQEAKKALDVLGMDPGSAVFLHFPDTGLTPRLLADGSSLLSPLQALLADFEPTLFLAPVLADCHPDHSAAAVLALALYKQQKTQAFRLVAYSTHASLAGTVALAALTGTEAEVATKRHAIATHRSQLVFRRRFHLSFARGTEHFWPITAAPAMPVTAALKRNRLEVSFRLPWSWRSLRSPVVTVISLGEKLEGFFLPLGRKRGLPLPPQLQAWYWQHHGGSEKLLLELAHAPALAMVKVSRPFFIYDETGFIAAAST